MFNPLEFQFQTTIKSLNEGRATLALNRGAQQTEIQVPVELLPTDLKPGDNFIMRMLPVSEGKASEVDSLHQLLQELIG